MKTTSIIEWKSFQISHFPKYHWIDIFLHIGKIREEKWMSFFTTNKELNIKDSLCHELKACDKYRTKMNISFVCLLKEKRIRLTDSFSTNEILFTIVIFKNTSKICRNYDRFSRETGDVRNWRFIQANITSHFLPPPCRAIRTYLLSLLSAWACVSSLVRSCVV